MGNSISNPSVKELSNLSNDIGQLFSSGDNYDMIIQAGEGQNMKEFFVHSLILAARSTYFKVELSLERKYKSSTIMISKLEKGGKLIGGYNPFSWNSNIFLNRWGSTSDSFLFSFANKKDLDSGSIARATSDNKYQKYAVFSSSDSGPAFGGRCGCGGCDLIIHGNSINRYVGAYPEVDSILHTKNTKTIVDYEIFQVIQV
ncbi:6340_t:CDS:2 [Funneliformis geosporum]|uniref:6340_t:CDS:1 n=1 Tax=Funneliformis geosporum TaxID=1117311 RepID=A0A9W4T328_9GLOM|nr:6340_t:CDS:2 [Funneliformis geosporum]